MKEALFEATVSVLNEHGVEGLTMERVAAAAGVAKGSLYRYFRSKRDLLEFVFTKTLDPIFQNMEKIAASSRSAVEKLREQLHMLFEHVARYAQLHRLLFEDETAQGVFHSSERRTIETASLQMAGIFRQGIDEGVFQEGDPKMLAVMYLGLCKGVLMSRPNLETPEQREKIGRMILHTFLNGAATERGRLASTAE